VLGSYSEINLQFANIVVHHQDIIMEELKQAPVKHLDETGFRIGGKTHWLQVISNGSMTHYRPTISRTNLLDGVTGVVVHDHWKPYFCMTNVQHGLCNAHHLRELKSLTEIEKEDWAPQMSKLLKLFSHFVDPPYQRISYIYDQIVSRGLMFHQQQPQLTGRKKRVGHNLLIRLRNRKDDTLRFLTSSDVPFTNNQAEQDIRMMKVKQKISGGFRTMQGAQTFCTIRGFISTKRKQGFNVFDAIATA
jgi:transposase